MWGALVAAADISTVALLLLAPLAAGVLLRLFMIQHDCSHNSFFPSERWNRLVGRILGILTLTPFDSWRAAHAYHHAAPGHLGKRGIGDILTLTTDEFAKLSLANRVLYRVYRHPLFLFPFAAPLAFLVLYRLPNLSSKHDPHARRSVHFTNAGLVLLWGTGTYCFGAHTFLAAYIPPVAIAAAVGAWFFFVQHQFEGTYWAPGSEWDFFDGSLRGSSHLELPKWANWFTGDVALHHIHHLNSRIPNYRLRTFAETDEVLNRWPRLHWRDGLKATRLGLWDPRQNRLVPFRAGSIAGTS